MSGSVAALETASTCARPRRRQRVVVRREPSRLELLAGGALHRLRRLERAGAGVAAMRSLWSWNSVANADMAFCASTPARLLPDAARGAHALTLRLM